MDASEKALVEQAVAGDRLAMDRLLSLHGLRLSRYLQPRMPQVLAGVVDVEDVLQQAFLQAYRDISDFRLRDQASFFAWLRMIADNRLMDCVRQQRRKKRGGDFRRADATIGGDTNSAVDMLNSLCGPNGTPSQSVGRREAEDILRAALSMLPADQCEAIERHCLAGETLKEAADAMGKTPGAIRALVHRGKARLKELIDRTDI